MSALAYRRPPTAPFVDNRERLQCGTLPESANTPPNRSNAQVVGIYSLFNKSMTPEVHDADTVPVANGWACTTRTEHSASDGMPICNSVSTITIPSGGMCAVREPHPRLDRMDLTSGWSRRRCICKNWRGEAGPEDGSGRTERHETEWRTHRMPPNNQMIDVVVEYPSSFQPP
jgi:hypothetical protein